MYFKRMINYLKGDLVRITFYVWRPLAKFGFSEILISIDTQSIKQ